MDGVVSFAFYTLPCSGLDIFNLKLLLCKMSKNVHFFLFIIFVVSKLFCLETINLHLLTFAHLNVSFSLKYGCVSGAACLIVYSQCVPIEISRGDVHLPRNHGPCSAPEL